MCVFPPHWCGSLRKMWFFINCLRAPDNSPVQMSYLNPRLPSSLPGAEVNSAFFTTHSSPSSLGFALLHWGVLVKHTALDGFTREESPGTDKLLSPEWCPQENPISAWDVLWEQMGSTGQINLVCSTCDSLGSCAGAGGWGGQFPAQKEAAIEGI